MLSFWKFESNVTVVWVEWNELISARKHSNFTDYSHKLLIYFRRNAYREGNIGLPSKVIKAMLLKQAKYKCTWTASFLIKNV